MSISVNLRASSIEIRQFKFDCRRYKTWNWKIRWWTKEVPGLGHRLWGHLVLWVSATKLTSLHQFVSFRYQSNTKIAWILFDNNKKKTVSPASKIDGSVLAVALNANYNPTKSLVIPSERNKWLVRLQKIVPSSRNQFPWALITFSSKQKQNETQLNSWIHCLSISSHSKQKKKKKWYFPLATTMNFQTNSRTRSYISRFEPIPVHWRI